MQQGPHWENRGKEDRLATKICSINAERGHYQRETCQSLHHPKGREEEQNMFLL